MVSKNYPIFLIIFKSKVGEWGQGRTQGGGEGGTAPPGSPYFAIFSNFYIHKCKTIPLTPPKSSPVFAL